MLLRCLYFSRLLELIQANTDISVCVEVAPTCLILVTLWTVACQAPLSMGFSRQECWSGLPCPPPGDPPNSRIKPSYLMFPALAGVFFTTEPPGKPTCHYAAAAAVKSLQSCLTLCDPIDGSPPGYPIPGILQARTLEWVATSSPMNESEK